MVHDHFSSICISGNWKIQFYTQPYKKFFFHLPQEIYLYKFWLKRKEENCIHVLKDFNANRSKKGVSQSGPKKTSEINSTRELLNGSLTKVLRLLFYKAVKVVYLGLINKLAKYMYIYFHVISNTLSYNLYRDPSWISSNEFKVVIVLFEMISLFRKVNFKPSHNFARCLVKIPTLDKSLQHHQYQYEE